VCEAVHAWALRRAPHTAGRAIGAIRPRTAPYRGMMQGAESVSVSEGGGVRRCGGRPLPAAQMWRERYSARSGLVLRRSVTWYGM
jgi:hypothetical protein